VRACSTATRLLVGKARAQISTDRLYRYEDEIARLQRELEARGGPSQNSQHHGPSQPQPPSIGHGPSNLFGGIMAGSASQGGPGLAPPPQEPQQPQGLPPHMGPQGPPPGLNPAPGPPQHFGGYQPPPSVNGKSISSFLLIYNDGTDKAG
jgi:glucose repression regulatory protein TUP1